MERLDVPGYEGLYTVDENGNIYSKRWENARGCRIEHEAAVAYGLEIIYE